MQRAELLLTRFSPTDIFSSTNPFLLWQSPGPYFSCHFTSRPGEGQLAFLKSLSPARKPWGLLILRAIAARKEKKRAVKKKKSFSGSLVPEEQRVAKALNEKKKIHQLTCHFQYYPWMGTLITDRLRVLSVPAISGNVRSLVLKVKLHSGRFFPSLCFILMHFL